MKSEKKKRKLKEEVGYLFRGGGSETKEKRSVLTTGENSKLIL